MKLSDVAYFIAHDGRGRLLVAESTYQRSYRPCMARFIEFFEDVAVTDLTREDLQDWLDWLDMRDMSVVTRNSYARAARAIFNHLRDRDVPVCDPSGIFRMRDEGKKGVKSISVANAWRMLAASGIRDAAILYLAMDSARRRGGLAALRLDNFKIIWNEDIAEYYVVGEVREKGDKPQILLAYHGAACALQAWLIIREELLYHLKVADHGYVFVDIRTGKPLSGQTMSALTTKIAQRAGIPADQPHNLHSFRHRRAKELLKHLSITEVRDILGHTNIKTTADQYAVNDKEELVAAFFGRAKPNGDEK